MVSGCDALVEVVLVDEFEAGAGALFSGIPGLKIVQFLLVLF